MSMQSPAMPASISSEELSIISLAFTPTLAETDLRSLLKYMNGLTPHRFTGVYRFEPGWVMSVALWDRENPQLEVGENVKMKESYCWLTGLGKSSYVIEDAVCDPRLTEHPTREAVRSYVSVALRDRQQKPWGTLCHFYFDPRKVAPGTIERLEYFRPLVEEILVRDAAARWEPETAST